jgi:transcriptional regulator NrdR family protein
MVEMTDEQMVADHNELTRKYNALQVKYIRLAAVLREFREAAKTCHEIITEHDDWEQLNQQKLNSTNEERQ